jgi:hypothetical protein
VVDARLKHATEPATLDGGLVPAALLELAGEVNHRPSNRVLAMSTARKLLAVPSGEHGARRDAERLLARHGPGAGR